jgi:hypothetical protein
MHLDELMASVMKGLQNAQLISTFRIRLKNETIMQDLRSLNPATLVQVLYFTHFRLCGSCTYTSGCY